MFAVDLASLRLSNDTGSFGNDRYTSDAALVGTVSGASSVEFDVDGNGQFGDPADGTASVVDGAFSFTPLLDDGTYTIVARAKVNDGYGGTFSDTKSLTFTLDRTPPATTVELLNDTGASSTDGLTNDDRLTGTVDDASPATVRVLVDIDNAGTFAHSATVSGGEWSLDPSLTDGAHTIRVKSIDLAGNEFTTLPMSFELDTTAPRVTEIYPFDKAELAAAPTIATFKFDEAIDRASITEQAMQVLAEAGPKPVQQGSHPTSNMAAVTFTNPLPPGKYTSQISDILDLAGNRQESAASASWTVLPPYNAPPTANPDNAQTNVDQPVEIDVLGNDSDSDGTLAPSSVTITTGAQFGSTTIDSSTGKVTYTPAAGFSGVDTFYYTVADNSGQVSQPAQVTVAVAPEQAAVRVFFANQQGKQVKNLAVSRWLTAFAPRFQADFIDTDPDSFRVVVMDPGRAGAGTIVVKLSTQHDDPDYASYADNATEIELFESATTAGQFVSKRMILVSDHVDDDASSADLTYPIATPADDAKNDRTHVVALGGKVVVEYERAAEPAKAKVPVEKVVNIHATVLINKQGKVLISDPYIDLNGIRWENDLESEKADGNYRDVDGSGAWTESLTQEKAKLRAEQDVRVINERFAQMGVRFVLSGVDFVHVAGLNNGIVRVTDKSVTGDAELTEDEKLLANANFRSADPNDIELVYVHGIRKKDTASSGRTFTADFYKDIQARDFNDIVLLPNQAKYFTPAHEVLHALRQDKDHPRFEYSLLSEFASDVAIESNTHIGSPKRITRVQAKSALEGPFLTQAAASAPQASRLNAAPAAKASAVLTVPSPSAASVPAATVSKVIANPLAGPISAEGLASLTMEELDSLGIAVLSVDDWADMGFEEML